jgi:CubicO group peptidase (beta-lactamase class C family)
MRTLLLSLAAIACSSPARPDVGNPVPAPDPAPTAQVSPPGPAEVPAETLAADTPKTTVAGNTFVAPAGWKLRVRGPATILEAPEGGSTVTIVDLRDAKDGDAAVEQAWKLTRGSVPYALIHSAAAADSDGWSKIRGYAYDVPPNARRAVGANVRFANDVWTVVLLDFDQAVAEKRGGQLGLLLGRLLPKGGARESFAGKPAHVLDAARIATLVKFVDDARAATKVPGVAFGVIQNGKVVFAGGSGVRQLGKPAKVDANTKFMIASNTKALATLMLAKLVDQQKIAWDTPATSLLPSFALGDPDTTSKVLVKHLICACTGLPRQDMEWLFQWDGVTPAKVLEILGTMQPTSKFGELFQYSNPLAAAAGFLGGHVAYPKLELGAAYDKAMQTLVFDPLGMKSTTHDYKAGARGNAAVPHAPDVDGKPALALAKVNTSIAPVRPAGGAWSTVTDMLKYVQMELAEGALPNGKRYIGQDTLLERRAPQIAIGSDASYGMGLMVNTTWGVTVVHHGGDLIGFHSDMMWLPEHGVGAVILTNGDPGWTIRSLFQRKLLEVLFDGKPEADAKLAASAESYFASIAAGRKLLTVPADPADAGALAAKYANPALGELVVKRRGAALLFDVGEYASEVASRKNPDGTVSFLTIAPGISGIEFVVGSANGKRTLILRDAQHEYVFTEAG